MRRLLLIRRERGIRLRAILRKEDGMEALQTVLIVAIAAICMILIKTQWWRVSDFFARAISAVME